MAATVTWGRLRELAAFRSEKGCAITVYVDLDPSVTPTAGDMDTRLRSLLSDIEKDRHGRARAGAPRGRRPDPVVVGQRVRPRRRPRRRHLRLVARQLLAGAPGRGT